jgi:POT family proton-dependent oligopeptide transporter
MVGGLYSKNDNNKRDMGFYIFYMGINIGAAVAALVVGYIGETSNWHYGFGLAGIGMAIGQFGYWKGQKYLSHVGNLIKIESTNESNSENLFLQIFKKNQFTYRVFFNGSFGSLCWIIYRLELRTPINSYRFCSRICNSSL